MSMSSRALRRTAIAAAATAALSITAAGASAATTVVAVATPSPGQVSATGDTIVAVATGQATPRPANPRSNSSIVAAVAKARALATPRALINAQVQAANMASASGLTLGPVIGVSQDTSAGLYSFYYSQLLSQLGPNRFCGPVTRSVVRRVNGKRTVVKRTTRKCEIPPFVTITLAVTFSASRP